MERASTYDGYLGIEPARNSDGTGVAAVYWRDLAAIEAWARDPEHRVAKRKGREHKQDVPVLRGEMTITITFTDADGGTNVLAVHEGLPSAVPAADNEAGWRSALAKLAALVEAG